MVTPLVLAAGLLVLSPTGAISAESYSNPVLPGDYPDPSVIRVGADYWATATSSEWAPLFPILHSRDLVHWEHVGNAFTRRPAWATANFWAPEISEYRGQFYIYYVGRKTNGPLSLAVATASRPEGPWTDHGPLMSQALGSIDAVTVVAGTNERWLLWKEDGNSRNQPTPIWAQQLSDDGTKLIGEMKEIFRNDAAWERNLVEGPFVQRHGDYYYCFYSGNACCGLGCNYALGVARSKTVLGPWEKNPKNPIIAGNDAWRCPGHGSIVTTPNGREFLLYHAYQARSFIYTGRQGVLDEVVWEDGWPVINHGRGVSTSAPAPLPSSTLGSSLGETFVDNFSATKLRPEWQWPVNREPRHEIQNGWLKLTAPSQTTGEILGTALAVKATKANYTASTVLDVSSLKNETEAGLSAYGDSANALGITVGNGHVKLYRRQKNKHETVAEIPTPTGPNLHLRLAASDGHRFRFAVSSDGKTWEKVGPDVDLEGNYLPPWDRGIRIALTTGGQPEASARFRSLRVE